MGHEQAALAAAKAHGVRLGGKRPNQHKVDPALGSAALAQASDELAKRVGPVIAELRQSGMGLRQIAAELTRRGYPHDARRQMDRDAGAQRAAARWLAAAQPAPASPPSAPENRPWNAYRPPGQR